MLYLWLVLICLRLGSPQTRHKRLGDHVPSVGKCVLTLMSPKGRNRNNNLIIIKTMIYSIKHKDEFDTVKTDNYSFDTDDIQSAIMMFENDSPNELVSIRFQYGVKEHKPSLIDKVHDAFNYFSRFRLEELKQDDKYYINALMSYIDVLEIERIKQQNKN